MFLVSLLIAVVNYDCLLTMMKGMKQQSVTSNNAGYTSPIQHGTLKQVQKCRKTICPPGLTVDYSPLFAAILDGNSPLLFIIYLLDISISELWVILIATCPCHWSQKKKSTGQLIIIMNPTNHVPEMMQTTLSYNQSIPSSYP